MYVFRCSPLPCLRFLVSGKIRPGEIYQIQDLTEQDLVNLRRTIYLTIMSSAGFEECAHKLTKLDVQEGYEMVRRRRIALVQ